MEKLFAYQLAAHELLGVVSAVAVGLGFGKSWFSNLVTIPSKFVSWVATISSFSVEAGWLGHEGGGVEHGLELQHAGNEQEEKTWAGCSQQEFLLEGPEGQYNIVQ